MRHIPPGTTAPSHGSRTVPPEERPDRRDGPTLSPVHVIHEDLPDAEDESDQRIRSLEDLMARFPFVGPDGDYFIRVNRVLPRSYMGMICHGVQRKVTSPLTYEQFLEAYGGGEYELVVYGPPRGPGMHDPATGKVRPKALTKPITFTVPYDKDGIYGIGPNPAAAIPEADEAYPMEPPMESQIPSERRIPHPFERGSRINTPADAQIRSADLQHEREMDAQKRAEKQAENERLIEESRTRAELEKESLLIQERREVRSTEIAREEAIREREDAQHERSRANELEKKLFERMNPPAPQTPPVDMPELIRAIKGDGSDIKVELQRAYEAHRDDIKRMGEEKVRDLERIKEDHKRDLERERSLAEERIRLAREESTRERDRAERLVKDADERAERRVKDIEDRAERRVEEVRKDHERQFTVAKDSWEARLRDEQRNNERDLTSRTVSYDLRSASEKTAFDVRMSSLEQEIARLRADNERLQREIAEKGDIVAQVEKVEKVAKSLGFEKAGATEPEDGDEKPPTDWRTAALAIGTSLVQQLPELVRSAGDTVTALRNRATVPPGAPPQAAPPEALPDGARGGRFHPQRRMTFATENEPLASAAPGTPMLASPPIYDHFQPPPSMPAPPPPPPPPQQPVAVNVPTYPEYPPVPPPPPPAPPRASVAPAPVAPSAPMSAEDEAMATQILTFKAALETAVENDEDPEQFIGSLVELAGADEVRKYAAVLSAKRITDVIGSVPGGSRSPLLKYAGKRWLERFEAAARAV